MHVDGVARAPAPQHVTRTRAMTSARIECKTGGAHTNFGGEKIEKIILAREKDFAHQEKSSSFSTNVPMNKGPDAQCHTSTANFFQIAINIFTRQQSRGFMQNY